MSFLTIWTSENPKGVSCKSLRGKKFGPRLLPHLGTCRTKFPEDTSLGNTGLVFRTLSYPGDPKKLSHSPVTSSTSSQLSLLERSQLGLENRNGSQHYGTGALDHRFQSRHPILECWLQSRLLCFQSNSLLMHLRRQQVLGPQPPPPRGDLDAVPDFRLPPGPALVVTAI